MLRSFFATGVADDSQFRYEPMDFAVDWGLPLIAKAAVAALTAASVILLAVLVVGFRAVRRRF